MSRMLPTPFAVLIAYCALSAVPGAIRAQQLPAKVVEVPRSNQVYVKIILPTDPPPLQLPRDAYRPVVESWIADQLEKRGRNRFEAAIAWVPIFAKDENQTPVWDGTLDDRQRTCHVTGEIVERAKGHIKVRLRGWSPGAASVTVSLRDEPGSRKIAPVEDANAMLEDGLIYVAVIIGPPPERPDGAADRTN